MNPSVDSAPIRYSQLDYREILIGQMGNTHASHKAQRIGCSSRATYARAISDDRPVCIVQDT